MKPHRNIEQEKGGGSGGSVMGAARFICSPTAGGAENDGTCRSTVVPEEGKNAAKEGTGHL
jgi:hypothetical protein